LIIYRLTKKEETNIALKGVYRLLQGLGGYPRGGRSCVPHINSITNEPLLDHQCSSRGSGATVEDINKGVPKTDIPKKEPRATLEQASTPLIERVPIATPTRPLVNMPIDLNLGDRNYLEQTLGTRG